MNAFETLLFQVFFGAALVIVCLEQVQALRRSHVRAAARWIPNLGLYVFSSVVSRLLMPVTIIGLAWNASSPGPLARLLSSPLLEALIGFLILDLANYGLHRLSHALPWLWRVHLVHHSDTLVDVTTTERHHPVEVLLSGAVLSAVVAGLGLSMPAVGAFAVSSAVIALWSHANIRLPPRWERALNQVLVTPGFHVIHHSSEQAETDSNFGTNLTLWDRLFGTFRPAQPAAPGRLGLEYLRRPTDSTLMGLLRQPFVRLDRSRPGSWPEPAEADAFHPADTGVPISPAWRSALWAGAIGLLPALAVLAPTSLTLAAQWQIDAYRHGWLVVPALVYVLGWAWREEVLALVPQPSWVGALAAAGAGLAWACATLMNIELGRQLAMVIAVQGLALAAVGWATYRRLFPAFALLILALPGGDVLQPVLRWLTLKGLEAFVALAGWPLQSEGYGLTIGTHRYFVADECAGLAFVTLMGFLGYCFGVLMFRSLRRVIALAILGAALGVLSNQLRIAGIVLTDQLTGSQMELQSHSGAQWVALALVMAVLLYVMSRLAPESLAAAAPRGATDVPVVGGRRRRAPALAGGLALLLIGGAVAWVERHDADAAAVPDARLPPVVGGWVMASQGALRPAAATTKDQVSVMTWAYERPHRTLDVSVIQPLSAAGKLSQQLAAPEHHERWRDIRREPVSACVGTDDCMEFVHVVWRLDRKSPLKHVYFSYGVGDVQTTSVLKLRAAAAWQRLRRAGNAHMVVLSTSGDEAAAADLVAMYRAVGQGLRGPAP
jgi:exosortase